MNALLAYAAPALTLTLVLARPRLLGGLRPGPAAAGLAGVLLLLLGGVIELVTVREAVAELLRPFIGVASIMATAAAAERLGLLTRLATLVEARTRGPVWHALVGVFVLSAVTATLFNNDAAILILTPAIVTLVQRRYPLRPYLDVPFAFAVFAAAGVAPLVISNPINLVVSSHAGIGFNEYAARMIPVALGGWVAALLALLAVFRRQVFDPVPGRGPEAPAPPPLSASARLGIAVLAAVLGAYPLVSYLGGPVWLVSLGGALLISLVAVSARAASPAQLARSVEWDVLVFLAAVFVMAQGLRSTGAVTMLAEVYRAAAGLPGQVTVIGTLSAVASAVLNNHPTAVLNALAIDAMPGASRIHVLAALIGGDLGPRLLPVGSLAGLMWLSSLRRHGVHVSLGTFVRVGAALTVPALAVSLALLLLVD